MVPPYCVALWPAGDKSHHDQARAVFLYIFLFSPFCLNLCVKEADVFGRFQTVEELSLDLGAEAHVPSPKPSVSRPEGTCSDLCNLE